MMFGSVCSGIEAATVAWTPLGWRAAWLAEVAPFPSAALAHHYPAVPNLGDMTSIARRVLTGEVLAPDVFCGGTPCQAFSVAGLRESLADARGNLTLKFVEIANAIDHVRAGRGEDECIVFWENVPGVLSTKDNAFGCFLAGLAGEDEPLVPPGQTPKPGQPWKWANAGAVYGPRRAVAWRTLDAQYFGVAQRRRRVFVVASARKGFDPAQVLFEWNGVRRDTAPSREARQTAPTIPSRSTAGGGLGTDFDCDGGLIQAYGGNNQSGPIDVATARNACASASGRMDFETETFLVAPTVGVQASQSGVRFNDTVGTLDANYGSRRHNGVMQDMQVRRLTPEECEALQGFPRGYTRIPNWNGWRDLDQGESPEELRAQGLQVKQSKKTGKWRVNDPDGPRYKALGNSWAVPNVTWIGRRIHEALHKA